MKNIAQKIFVLAFASVFLSQASAWGRDRLADVAIEANCLITSPDERGMRNAVLVTYITNISDKRLTMPTANIGPVVSFENGKAEIYYRIITNYGSRNRICRTSLYSYFPVELEPGELIRLETTTNIPVDSCKEVWVKIDFSNKEVARYNFLPLKTEIKANIHTNSQAESQSGQSDRP